MGQASSSASWCVLPSSSGSCTTASGEAVLPRTWSSTSTCTRTPTTTKMAIEGAKWSSDPKQEPWIVVQEWSASSRRLEKAKTPTRLNEVSDSKSGINNYLLLR